MNQQDNREIKKGPIAWMAGNSVAANLLMLILLVGGLLIGAQIKQEVFPEFSSDIVEVRVSYPGASPEEVERGIILAIEDAVQGLDGVDEIKSTAYEGSAKVSIEAIEGFDLRVLASDVESEVDAITTFPDEAEEPRINVASRKREVLNFVVYGPQKEAILREIAEEFRDDLLQDPSITQVELEGIRDFEIHVEVPQENLRRYNLTLSDIATRIRNVSVELPGGSLKTEGGEVLVRMKERRDLAVEYARIPIITLDDGSRVLLEDIAEIKEGFTESDTYGTFNGQPAVLVNVYRIGDQTPITVADAAKQRMTGFKAGLPRGVDIDLIRDRSDIYKERAELLLKNAYIGLALVFVFLALFLEIRLAFWVSLGIPISVLGSFLLLSPTDFSINMISMFGFIVTLGIVVDDAIVVGENIYYLRQQGASYFEAACRGAREIAMPVTFAVLTNIVAFMPLYFIPGIMGKIFKVIPMVVITVFAISLVESLFILPAHLGHQKPDKNSRGLFGWIVRQQQKFSAAFTRFISNYYGPFLAFALKRRYTAFSIGLALLIITGGYVFSGRMGMTLMPRTESNFAYVSATLPYGSAESRTAAVMNMLVDAANKIVEQNGGDQLSKGIFAIVSENVVTARVYLTPYDVRPMSTTDLTMAWRKEVGEIPGLENLSFESDRGGPGSGKSLTVELSHRNIPALNAAGYDLAARLAEFPKVKDIDDGSAQGKKQFDFQMKPEGERLGLTSQNVAIQVRHSFYGADALKLQRGRNEVTIVVRRPKNERISESSLEDMIVRLPAGGETMLRDVVTMDQGRAYTSIGRRDGRRTISVTADVFPRSQSNQVIAVLKEDVLPALQNKYPGLTYSFQGRQADQQESVDSLFNGLIMALMVIYAMLAIPFRSFAQPFIIMTCIPFGFVGVVAGHMIMGYSLSVMSLFGVVALSGVVVNDSLILIDFANRRKASGLPVFEAIHASGIHRFRPILLTTLTTFGGLAPMIFETSRQARFMIPMAISLGFGIVFATFITLVLVPTLYLIFEDFFAFFRSEEKEPEEKAIQDQEPDALGHAAGQPGN